MSWTLVGATIAHFFLGAIWYGPLFGSLWLRLCKKNEKDLTTPWAGMATSIVGGFIALAILEQVVALQGATTAAAGAALGVVAAVFDAAMHASHPMFEDRPFGIFVIGSLYHAVSYVIAGAMFANAAGAASV